ncbi:MAG: CPBP family intramembrane glutamic endopeptidase [Chloroherpetonaceae bacterium]|nr:CPBP family intramembrane metalloprotease [Chloroherpetonaceae bacterium]MCS7211130.1 CPBP family intramembrane metalloprotease [Chloroherpetonaceae bacterium]MDW8019539.1 CPBP family intramembrane glutamic endopeptidase [Chloroherpetonaceae bacterium]
MAISSSPSATPSSSELGLREKDLQLCVALICAIWLLGFAGHFTPLKEWGALFLYVIGSLALVLWYGKRFQAFEQIFLTRQNLSKALLWSSLIGSVLFLMDVGNTYFYYKKGGEPMKEMQTILVDMGFLYLFPVLILAEEFLWRGLFFSALLRRGMNRHLVVALTTLLYMLNHYAVAPVGFYERSLMAMMALPIGIAGGYLVLKTRNVWAGVWLHFLTMISMTLDIFLIPAIAKP